MRIYLAFIGVLCASSASATERFEDAVIIRSTVVSNGNLGFCSGVLLDKRHVLTAAHCIVDNKDHEINFSNKKRRWVGSANAVPHPNYVHANHNSYYDIGIIKLDEDVNDENSKPICEEQDHERYFRVGFGRRDDKKLKMSFEIKPSTMMNGDLTYIFFDSYSVSGDSGGPVYSIEDDRYCLAGIHSSVGVDQISTYSTRVNAVIDELLSALAENRISE